MIRINISKYFKHSFNIYTSHCFKFDYSKLYKGRTNTKYDKRENNNYNSNHHSSIKKSTQKELVNTIDKQDNRKLRRIIDNPEEPVILSEIDIHSALMKTGNLPEFELKELIAKMENSTNLHKEIEIKILSKLNICLNKSLVELCKLAKNNPIIFKHFENFWKLIEEELDNRQDSLSNEHIVDLVSSYSKCQLTQNIKFFENFEEIILESPVPFQLSQLEKIFYSFCAQKKGSTAFLKFISKKYFRDPSIHESWRLAKFISELNSHPNTIKGNFGLMGIMEEVILKDIEKLNLKFVDLISIADYLFSNNLGSNDLQKLIENALVEKFNNNIPIEVSQVIKLIKSLPNYYLKNEKLCYEIKNYIQKYLNVFVNNENNSENNNMVPLNIDLTFNEYYTKIITNINVLVWSFSRNEMFLSLAIKPEFEYFYKRLKDLFIKNIEYYNGREFIFSLEGINRLLEKNKNTQTDKLFAKSDAILINNKIKLLQFTNHDLVKLLKILTSNEDLLINSESIEYLIKSSVENYDKLSYKDLIDLPYILEQFPYYFETLFLSSKEVNLKIQSFENQLSKILKQMDIIYFCRMINLLGKPFLYCKLSNKFEINLLEILKLRIDEVPKESFCEILATCATIKANDIICSLIDILEDLSHFDNIMDCFNKPEQYLNLLWTFLSLYHQENNNSNLNPKQIRFIQDTLNKFINPLITETIDNKESVESKFKQYFIQEFLLQKLNIDFFLSKNSQNKNLYPRYLQVVYLSFLYIKDTFKINDLFSIKTLLDHVNSEVYRFSLKFDLNSRNDFLNLDPAIKCDKTVISDIQKEVLIYFKPKVNTTIYNNYFDEFLNPINLVINFELPNLKENEEVVGIDSKVFAIIINNQHYFNKNNKVLTNYDNRILILKEIFNFEVKIIDENYWKETYLNRSSEVKQDYFIDLFGFDLSDENNLKIHIKGEYDKIELLKKTTKKQSPKYKLTEKLINSK